MEPTTQNSTNPQTQQANSLEIVKDKDGKPLLTPQQDDYVSYLALGGLLPAEDGPGTKVTVGAFAIRLGVARETLYYWRKHIPGLWDLVAQRRQELGGKDRLAQAWNAVFLGTLKGNSEMAKLYLANFDPNFRMPTEKIEHEAGGGFMDLLQRMREGGTNRQVIDYDEAMAAEAELEKGALNANAEQHTDNAPRG